MRWPSGPIAWAALAALAGCQPADDAAGARRRRRRARRSSRRERLRTARSRASPGASSRFGGPAPPRSRWAPEPQYTVAVRSRRALLGSSALQQLHGRVRACRAGALRIRAGAATLAACPQPSIADEYLRALASVTDYSVSGEELLLTYNTGGELEFVREPQQAAAAPEVGRTFVFDCDGDVSFTMRTGPARSRCGRRRRSAGLTRCSR